MSPCTSRASPSSLPTTASPSSRGSRRPRRPRARASSRSSTRGTTGMPPRRSCARRASRRRSGSGTCRASSESPWGGDERTAACRGARGEELRVSGAATFARVIAAGGVAVFAADTVYGLACDPEDPAAVDRLYALKGRPPEKPAAGMFFDRDAALDGLRPRTRALLERLLPGGVTALLPNPDRRFPLACGPDPDPLGLRVPIVPALAGAPPVLQSSANVAGGPDARRLTDVPQAIRDGADLVLDGGELPGTPSTVLDLRGYEDAGVWTIVRHGAGPEGEIAVGAAYRW